MNISHNEKIVKAIAFEKAIIELLKKENPQIQEGFGTYEDVDGKIRRFHQYDAVISNRLNLSCFKMERIHANKIAIEIKAGQPPREILRRFIAHHVHGYIPFDYDGKVDVANFIFTDKEYYDNMSNPISFSNTTQSTILNNKNVIFVGVSFTDSNMKEILRKRVSNGYRCFYR